MSERENTGEQLGARPKTKIPPIQTDRVTRKQDRKNYAKMHNGIVDDMSLLSSPLDEFRKHIRASIAETLTTKPGTVRSLQHVVRIDPLRVYAAWAVQPESTVIMLP